MIPKIFTLSIITILFQISIICPSILNAQWESCNNGLTCDSVWCINANKNNVYAGTEGSGIYLSTNNGDNWIAKNQGLNNLWIRAIAITENNVIFAGTEGGGINISIDNGNNWTTKNQGLKNLNIWSLAIKGNYIFAGTEDGGLYLSSDNGNSWVEKNKGIQTNLYIMSITINENNIFIGTWDKGIYLSTDNGNIWNTKIIGLKDLYIRTLTSIGDNIFAGTFSGGIFLSTDNGDIWLAKNIGLTSLGVYSFSIDGNNIYAGTQGGIFRAKISDITAVKDKVQITENIIYPNPASDFLNINSANIIGKNINIYDMLGNKVISATAESTATHINVEFLPVGVYLIRIGEQTKMFVKE